MAWDPNKPADNSAIRLAPSSIRANWSAIATADSTFTPAGFNFAQQGTNLGNLDSVYRLFSKASGGNTELFGINNDNKVNQFTFKSPTLNATDGEVFLGGNGTTGLLAKWGSRSGLTGDSTIITFSSPTPFSDKPYYVNFTTTTFVLSINGSASITSTGFAPQFNSGSVEKTLLFFAIGPVKIT